MQGMQRGGVPDKAAVASAPTAGSSWLEVGLEVDETRDSFQVGSHRRGAAPTPTPTAIFISLI